MNKENLMKVEHLDINQVEDGLFHHVHVEEGYMLTSWNENDDIKEYQGFECLYMPIADEYVDFRVISKEEHDSLEAQAEEAREAEREEQEEIINKKHLQS